MGQEEKDIDLTQLEYEEGYIQVPTADCKGVKMSDAVFLGPQVPQNVRLYLKEVLLGCLYTVHDAKNEDNYGYLIHMLKGIVGPDFEQFHSDEGWYEVGVVQNGPNNPVDFIALLGSQNELYEYEMDRLAGRVDIDDLHWFNQHVKKFTDCADFGPSYYPNKKHSYGSSSSPLNGIYAIIANLNGKNGSSWS